MSYTKEIKDKISELASKMSEECTAVGYGFKEKDGKLTKEKSIIFICIRLFSKTKSV